MEGGSYELYSIPKEAARGDTAPVSAGQRHAQRRTRSPAVIALGEHQRLDRIG